MQVDVYIRTDEGKQLQFMLLPEGKSDFPEPAVGKSWRRLFAMNLHEPLLDVPLRSAEADLKRKGFAIIRPDIGTKDWAHLSEEELDALEEPDTWQDKWHVG